MDIIENLLLFNKTTIFYSTIILKFYYYFSF